MTFALIGAMVSVMWVVEALDTFVLDDRLQAQGIVPRRSESLDGIAWAPFLHVGWRHLVANTIPLVVLGGLVALGGVRRWIFVTVVIAAVSGGAVWLLARSGNHIGASGLVFGYFGTLIGAVVFDRRLAPIVPAAVAVVLYGGAIVGGVLPTQGVSWEGHVFGAGAGLLAARIVRHRRPDPLPV